MSKVELKKRDQAVRESDRAKERDREIRRMRRSQERVRSDKEREIIRLHK